MQGSCIVKIDEFIVDEEANRLCPFMAIGIWGLAKTGPIEAGCAKPVVVVVMILIRYLRFGVISAPF